MGALKMSFENVDADGTHGELKRFIFKLIRRRRGRERKEESYRIGEGGVG